MGVNHIVVVAAQKPDGKQQLGEYEERNQQQAELILLQPGQDAAVVSQGLPALNAVTIAEYPDAILNLLRGCSPGVGRYHVDFIVPGEVLAEVVDKFWVGVALPAGVG